MTPILVHVPHFSVQMKGRVVHQGIPSKDNAAYHFPTRNLPTYSPTRTPCNRVGQVFLAAKEVVGAEISVIFRSTMITLTLQVNYYITRTQTEDLPVGY